MMLTALMAICATTQAVPLMARSECPRTRAHFHKYRNTLYPNLDLFCVYTPRPSYDHLLPHPPPTKQRLRLQWLCVRQRGPGALAGYR